MTRSMAIALVCAASAIACPGVTRPLARPVVRVLDMAPTAAADSATLRVRVRLTVHNTNQVALSARALDWRLFGDSLPALRGRVSLDRDIPAGRATTVELFLDIDPASALAIQARSRAQEPRFRLAGTIHLFSPRGDLGAVFDQPVDLAALPQMR